MPTASIQAVLQQRELPNYSRVVGGDPMVFRTESLLVQNGSAPAPFGANL